MKSERPNSVYSYSAKHVRKITSTIFEFQLYKLELDLWQVYAYGDVSASCTQTLNVSRLGPRPRHSQRGCFLMLPLSVFTIDRAYPNT